jgi:hypothetical protein
MVDVFNKLCYMFIIPQTIDFIVTSNNLQDNNELRIFSIYFNYFKIK